MGEIIQKTYVRYRGPWLLDSNSLSELDSILNEQWKILVKRRKQIIDREVRRRAEKAGKYDYFSKLSDDERKARLREYRKEEQAYYKGDKLKVSLKLRSGNKVEVESFAAAKTDVHCQGEPITDVGASLECGRIRGEISIETPGSITVSAYPEASSHAAELFVKLNSWAMEHKPGWFRIVRSHGGVIAWLLLLPYFLLCVMIAHLLGGTRNAWTEDATSVLKDGITLDEQGRAIELLLRKAANIQTSDVITLSSWFYVAIGVGTVFGTVMTIRALPAIEIGKGVASVKWEKNYDWCVTRLTPSFLILGVGASLVASFIFGLF